MIEQLNDISIENLKINGGTLNLSYKEMLDKLNENDIFPRTNILSVNDKPIGYIMFYVKGEEKEVLHIYHICIEKRYQGKHMGDVLIDSIRDKCEYRYCTLTADICYGNGNAYSFFRRNGFDIIDDPNKPQFNATLFPWEERRVI